MKKIEVIILADGITAKESNPFGNKRPTDDITYTKGNTVIISTEKEYIYKAQLQNWERAEKGLRTFKIDSQDEVFKNIGEPKITSSNAEIKIGQISANILYKPDSKQYAVVLPSSKIKIIPDKDSFCETFADKMVGRNVINGIDFVYTNIGEPHFMKEGAKCADKENSISLRDWTPEQLEAMANFMRNNPLCRLFTDGSGEL